jgi:hypothetical protein
MSHAHVHAPHELSESAEGGVSRRERVLELFAVLLLSLTTVATAWSGYQAARWSGEQSEHYAEASALRVRSQQQSTLGGQLRIADLLNFNGWLNARDRGDEHLQAVYERRFRAEFVPAFRAWRAQSAIPGPQYMPQYKVVELARSAALDAQATEEFAIGSDAKDNDDHYILSTVFFATVLFFAGISLRLEWLPLRAFVLGLASLMLLGGAGYVLSLPVAHG